MQKNILLIILLSSLASLSNAAKIKLKCEIYNKKDFYYESEAIWFKVTLINTSQEELRILPPKIDLKIFDKKTGEQLKSEIIINDMIQPSLKLSGFRLQPRDSVIDFFNSQICWPEIEKAGEYLVKSATYSSIVSDLSPWEGIAKKEMNLNIRVIKPTGANKKAFDLWQKARKAKWSKAGEIDGKDHHYYYNKLFSLYPESPYACEALYSYAENPQKIEEFIKKYPDSPYILKLFENSATLPQQDLYNLKKKYSNNTFIKLRDDNSPYVHFYKYKWPIINSSK